jgi:hypothetical protein
MLLKIFSFCTIQQSSVSTGFTEQIMPILRILCYNGTLVTWTVVSFTTAKCKPVIFSVPGFTLSCTYLRSWALPEKLPIVQPLRNFPAFFGNRRWRLAVHICSGPRGDAKWSSALRAVIRKTKLLTKSTLFQKMCNSLNWESTSELGNCVIIALRQIWLAGT